MSCSRSRCFADWFASVAALAALALTATLVGSGCGGDDDDGGSPTSSGGDTGQATGGSGGGGTSTGGSSSGGGANGGGTADFWEAAYNPSGAPDPAAGHHNAGQACMSCHADPATCDNNPMLFAGTVYQADGTTPAASVEVGVADASGFWSAYSAADGNFWVRDDGSTITWSGNPDVRMRTSAGEVDDGENLVAADCNLCHVSGGSATPLTAP